MMDMAETRIKELADKSGADVAVVWVRRLGNFKVFSHQGEITPKSTLGHGLVTGGDDIAEGVEAALILTAVGINPAQRTTLPKGV